MRSKKELDPFMILYALVEIAHELGVEKFQGQAHYFLRNPDIMEMLMRVPR